MGKSNAERQAEFRARMKAEGKQALPLWVTPQQAAQIRALLDPASTITAQDQPLPVTKAMAKRVVARVAPPALLLPVTERREMFVVPPIPNGMPEPLVRDLKENELLAQKKRAQIKKLENQVAAIERLILRSIAECKDLKPLPVARYP